MKPASYLPAGKDTGGVTTLKAKHKAQNKSTLIQSSMKHSHNYSSSISKGESLRETPLTKVQLPLPSRKTSIKTSGESLRKTSSALKKQGGLAPESQLGYQTLSKQKLITSNDTVKARALIGGNKTAVMVRCNSTKIANQITGLLSTSKRAPLADGTNEPLKQNFASLQKYRKKSVKKVSDEFNHTVKSKCDRNSEYFLRHVSDNCYLSVEPSLENDSEYVEEAEVTRGSNLRSVRNRDMPSSLSLQMTKKHSSTRHDHMSKLNDKSNSISSSILHNYISREISQSSLGLEKPERRENLVRPIQPVMPTSPGKRQPNSNQKFRDLCMQKGSQKHLRNNNDRFNVNNYKKSFSISVLERPVKKPSLVYHRHEYNNPSPSLSPHHMKAHSSLIFDKCDSSDDYGRVGIHLVKNTESDDGVSSIGSVSNHSRRQVIKNQSNLGALKNLAVYTTKIKTVPQTQKNSIRNSPMASYQLEPPQMLPAETLDNLPDEGVRVSAMPIKETVKHEAMSKLNEPISLKNKFRKHYGSVVVPESVKNRFVFGSILEEVHEGSKQLVDGRKFLSPSPSIYPKYEDQPLGGEQININIKSQPNQREAGLLGKKMSLKGKVPISRKKVDKHMLAKLQSDQWKESLANFKRSKNNSHLGQKKSPERVRGVQTVFQSPKHSLKPITGDGSHGRSLRKTDIKPSSKLIQELQFTSKRKSHAELIINTNLKEAQYHTNNSKLGLRNKSPSINQNKASRANLQPPAKSPVHQNAAFEQKKLNRKSTTPNNKFGANVSNALRTTPRKMKRPVSLENVQEDKFVEQIVDLLEQKHLIDPKAASTTKPKVNQMLKELIRQHFKYENQDENDESQSPSKAFGQEALKKMRDKSVSQHSRGASSLQNSDKSSRNHPGDSQQKIEMTSPGQLYYAHPSTNQNEKQELTKGGPSGKGTSHKQTHSINVYQKGDVRFSTSSRENSGSYNSMNVGGPANLKYMHQLQQIVEHRKSTRKNSESDTPSHMKSPSTHSSGFGYLNQQQYESKNHIQNISNDRSEAFFQRIQKNDYARLRDSAVKEHPKENIISQLERNQSNAQLYQDNYQVRNGSSLSQRQRKTISALSESEGAVATEHIGTMEISREDTIVMRVKSHFSDVRKKDKPFPTSLHCYKVHNLIGKGAFGKVALATHKLTGKSVALKMMDKTSLKPGQLEKVIAEVKLMSAIRHRHVIRLLEVFETQHHLFMVLEHAGGGDLLHLVKKRRALTEDEARPLFRQIVYGIAHCHCRSVLHRDIKLDNILLDENGLVKVCDFGISKLLVNPDKTMYEQCGTPAYIAPEVLSDTGYHGFKSDVWGLGVLLYAMVCGTVPFRAANMRELKSVIQSGNIRFPQHHLRDAITPFSSGIQNLIRNMCSTDQMKRITIPEILSDSWLNDGNQNSPTMRAQLHNGLTIEQLRQTSALQPFISYTGEPNESCPLQQIKPQNLFPSAQRNQEEDVSQNEKKLTSPQIKISSIDLNEIALDHATVHINENIIARLESYGFPAAQLREQVQQGNVLNYATASYNLLVL